MFFVLPRAFVVGEKERTIFADRSAQRSAEDVAIQFQRFIRLAVEKFGSLHQIIIGAGERVARILVGRAMEAVAAALGDQRDLGS